MRLSGTLQVAAAAEAAAARAAAEIKANYK